MTTPYRRACLLMLIAGVLSSCATAASQAAATPGLSREAAVMGVLDAFMASFSGRDAAMHVATYHFPHYRLARGEMNQWPTEADALQAHIALFKTLPDTGWHRSEWVRRDVLSSSDSKVHVATQFRRLREDGSEIGRYESLYVLIWRDGRWGIKLRSSFL